MSELIDKQAAVDIAKELTITVEGYEMHNQAVMNYCAEIMQLPSAQPDIIRCKDCKWYGRADKRRFYRGMDCLQKRIDTIVPDRDFCSRAERKKNGL